MTVPERCTLERDGFTALWYPGRISPEKAIIAVGGASCDERTSVLMSRFIREAGYNVLVLGFYMWKGLPKDLVSIPVDYAERAAKWLKEKKGISKIAMTGTSTGAGYTPRRSGRTAFQTGHPACAGTPLHAVDPSIPPPMPPASAGWRSHRNQGFS